jgi:hypothetical protein
MGPVRAVFKADGDETRGRYSISEWWLAARLRDRTGERAGALNVSVPGNFEPAMEGIAEWFRARSDAESRTANALPGPTGSHDRDVAGD